MAGESLDAGKRFPGQLIGYKSGKPYLLIHNACSEPAEGWDDGDKILYRRAGLKSGVPWGVMGTGPCGEDGKPQVGERYKAILVGTKGGKPYYVMFCADCEDDPVECDPDGGCCGCGAKDWPDDLTVTIDIACMSAPFSVLISNPDPLSDHGVFECGISVDPEIYEPGDIVGIMNFTGTMSDTGIDEATFSATRCNNGASVSTFSVEQRFASVGASCKLYVDENYCVKSYWFVTATVEEYEGGEIREATIQCLSETPTVNGLIPGYDDDLGNYCAPNMVIEECDPFVMTASGELVCVDGDRCERQMGSTPYTNCVGSAWTVEITE